MFFLLLFAVFLRELRNSESGEQRIENQRWIRAQNSRSRSFTWWGPGLSDLALILRDLLATRTELELAGAEGLNRVHRHNKLEKMHVEFSGPRR